MSTDPSDVDVDVNQLEQAVADLRDAGVDDVADRLEAAADRARELVADD